MSFQRYPKYKDSGVEWLGKLPAHWTLKKLKYAANFASGGTPSKAIPAYWDGDVPWASSKDLKSESLTDTTDHITEKAVVDGAQMIEAGDLMVVVRGMILAHTFPVTKALVRMAINQDLKGVRPLTGWQSDYFAHVLRASSPETFRRLDEAGHGTKALRMEAWVGMEIPCPPEAEQAAIAAFLDRETAKIDALVAEQERLIELLKEKRQAVISHAVTKGLNPDAPMKDSGVGWLGRIPAHWKTIQSRRMFRVRSEPAREADRQLTASQKYGVLFQSDFVEAEGRRVVEVIKWTENLLHVEPDDFIISMRSFQSGIEWCGLRGSTSYHYVMLTPVKHVFPPFFARLFKSSSYIQALRTTTDLIRDGQELRYSHFVQVDLPVVPLAEQESIANFLDVETRKIDPLIQQAQRAIDLLQERRTALISAAVTGQIDVRSAAERPAA